MWVATSICCCSELQSQFAPAVLWLSRVTPFMSPVSWRGE